MCFLDSRLGSAMIKPDFGAANEVTQWTPLMPSLAAEPAGRDVAQQCANPVGGCYPAVGPNQ